MPIEWLPFVLQTTDPLFPTGSYAHSFGLEEYVRLTSASTEAHLHHFLHHQIIPALAQQELPYLRFAHGCSIDNDLAGLISLDHEINAWKIAAELRTASLRLGSRRMDILLKTVPTPLLDSISERIASGVLPGHHLTITAAQYSMIPLEAALTTYFYQALSSYCVAAIKLLRIGQEACQRVLTSALERTTDTIRDSLSIERPDAGIFNPLLDIAAMRHQAAHERLFIS